jgi:methylated-DNA-[protein]-cysteine S-methyltransferase
MTLEATELTTGTGRLALIARDGVAVAAGFAPIDEMAARIGGEPVTARRDLGPLSRAVAAYFAGELTALDDLPVEQAGGDFFQAAWKAMRDVPPGQTISYSELADRAGRPAAVRAAGSACARNLVAPIVPCHRILRAGATLGGYYYGLGTKEWLLAHERRFAQAG